MPRREDIRHVLVIGSGPIVIGQACEFDYSGHPGLPGAAGRGHPGLAGQLQPGDDHDRPGVRRRHLHRADHPGVRRAGDRGRAAGRHPGHPGRADRAEHRGRAARERGAGALRRGADRRRHRRHPARRGPAEVQADRAVGRRGRAAQRGLPLDGRGARRGCRARAAGGHPALVHHGRAGLRDGPRRRRPGAAGRRRAGRLPGARGADRGVGARLEGVRARADARPPRQRGGHLLHREPGPDGRAHRRLDHRGAGDDPDRPRVPAHARRRDRGAARGRRGHRRLQHPVRGAPGDRPPGRDRDEPAGVPVVARWPPRPPASRSPRSPPGWPSATPSTRSATTSPARPRPRSSRRWTTWWSRCRGSRSRSSPAPIPS